MRIIHRIVLILALAVLVFGTATTARADSFDVSLDTSSLTGTTQILAFGLTGTMDNSVSLSDFTFGGGSAIDGTADCTLGGSLSGTGCSGNLTSGVSLTDSDFLAFFTEEINVGDSLSVASFPVSAFYLQDS